MHANIFAELVGSTTDPVTYPGIIQLLTDNTHTAADIASVQLELNKLLAKNPPFPGHGGETAWMHCFMCYRYASIPAGGTGYDEAIASIICELGHNMNMGW